MEILRICPIFKQMIWGGNRLKSEFGYDIPGDDTGECWAISAHPQGDCVVKNGKYAGIHLSTLWNKHRELFGDCSYDRFPLLVKIIDAKEDLSIQVHPSNEYALKNENGSYGKTECWYILNCDENASIIIGHNAKTKEQLHNMVHGGRWKELICEIPVKKGDFFQIVPGTVHAIKGGTMLLETQQSSDITYRLYDYDRLQNGKPRELHIEKSLDVINVPYIKPELNKTYRLTCNTWFDQLVNCDEYTVWHAQLDGKKSFVQDQNFMLCSVISGKAQLDEHFIKKGEHFIVPSGTGEAEISGEAELIISSI